MRIPHTELNQSTLKSLIEEFVSRDGTDYGEIEVSLDEKIAQIIQQLDNNEIFIVFDAETESCTMVTADYLNANPESLDY